MAKKSSSKTGTKKKTVAKKKATLKKTETKKTPAKKSAPAAKKTTAAAKKPASTSKPKKRKPTKKSILKRKFDAWIPADRFTPSPDTGYEHNFSAPPAIAEGEKDFERIKKLLLKPATLKAPQEKKTPKTSKTPAAKKPKAPSKTKKAAPAATDSKKKNADKPEAPAKKEKSAIPIKTLLMQRFDSWAPESIPPPAKTAHATIVFTAPPAIEAADADHAARLKALLLKKIDFTTPVEPFSVPGENDSESDEVLDTQDTQDKIDKPGPETAEPETTVQPDTETPAAQETSEAEITPVSAPEVDTAPDSEPPDEPADEPVDEPSAEKEATPTPEAVQDEAPIKETDATPEKKVETETGTPSEPEVSVKPEALPAGEPPAWKEPESSSSIPGPLKALIACIVVIVALLVMASMTNMKHYYLIPKKVGIEIWKGDFSPNGKEKIAVLPLAKAPEEIKDVYTKSEAYEMIYFYNMRQAAKLIQSQKPDDLEKAKTYVDTAGRYALSAKKMDRVSAQRSRINAKLKAASAPSVKK